MAEGEVAGAEENEASMSSPNLFSAGLAGVYDRRYRARHHHARPSIHHSPTDCQKQCLIRSSRSIYRWMFGGFRH